MTICKLKFLDGPFKDETRIISRDAVKFGEYRFAIAPYRITPDKEAPETSKQYSYIGVYRVVSERTYRVAQMTGAITVVLEAQFVGVDGPIPKNAPLSPTLRGFEEPITVTVEDFEVTIKRRNARG